MSRMSKIAVPVNFKFEDPKVIEEKARKLLLQKHEIYSEKTVCDAFKSVVVSKTKEVIKTPSPEK